MIKAEIIEDSVNENGKRITTVLCIYPRYIHSEVMTHRVFSRNAGSSRAIPTKKLMEFIKKNSTAPKQFKRNQSGMVPGDAVSGLVNKVGHAIWDLHMRSSIAASRLLNMLGVHKQWANRLMEPHAHIQTLITATEWDNFFSLRCATDAQDEIYELAWCIRHAMAYSTPKNLSWGEWHLPFVSSTERQNTEIAKMLSAARCARISYLTDTGFVGDKGKELARAQQLKDSRHSSCFEHQAKPTFPSDSCQGNFSGGWVQFRKTLGI